jgi:acyl dehydratase
MTIHERSFGRYFEDFVPGDIYRHWPGKTITEYDNHLFSLLTMNHHPLHLDAYFAEHGTVHHDNVVVGSLVYSLVLGMSVADVSGSCIANLAVDELVHKVPTFVGDTIYAETLVMDKRASRSKADRGVVRVKTKGFNQHGAEVCHFLRSVMVWRQGAALGSRPRPYPDDVWAEEM